MSNAEACRFNPGHLWCRECGEGVMEVGISDHAQDSLGEIMYFELPEPGANISAGESFGSVESVKVVNDLIGPVSGEVIETNSAIEDDPALANRDPYGGGWLVRVRMKDDAPSDLMDLRAYEEYLQGA